MANHLLTVINSSTWDVQCSLRNGYNTKESLKDLKEARDVLEDRMNSARSSKTMLKLVTARIKKLEAK